jgi:predicted DNA-binding transcriptional regulator AlpA
LEVVWRLVRAIYMGQAILPECTENPLTTSTSILDASGAAAFLGLSQSTLAKLRLSGSGPVFLKLGRRVFYQLADLERWIASRRFASTSAYGTEHRH